jgi:hypothetical protein
MRDYGWSVTCLFYAALHLVEAYLQQLGAPSGNHNERRNKLRQEASLLSVQRRYGVLKQESENARYECRLFSAQETTHLRDFVYAPLASHVRGLLGVN